VSVFSCRPRLVCGIRCTVQKRQLKASDIASLPSVAQARREDQQG
jgi:hypothetical protein